jgi:hypothetical protein
MMEQLATRIRAILMVVLIVVLIPFYLLICGMILIIGFLRGLGNLWRQRKW